MAGVAFGQMHFGLHKVVLDPPSAPDHEHASVQTVSFTYNDIQIHKRNPDIVADVDAAIITMPGGTTLTLSPLLANPICLPHGLTGLPHLGTEDMIFTGWGIINATDISTTRYLQKSIVNYVDTPFCEKLMKPLLVPMYINKSLNVPDNVLTDNMICAIGRMTRCGYFIAKFWLFIIYCGHF